MAIKKEIKRHKAEIAKLKSLLMQISERVVITEESDDSDIEPAALQNKDPAFHYKE